MKRLVLVVLLLSATIALSASNHLSPSSTVTLSERRELRDATFGSAVMNMPRTGNDDEADAAWQANTFAAQTATRRSRADVDDVLQKDHTWLGARVGEGDEMRFASVSEGRAATALADDSPDAVVLHTPTLEEEEEEEGLGALLEEFEATLWRAKPLVALEVRGNENEDAADGVGREEREEHTQTSGEYQSVASGQGEVEEDVEYGGGNGEEEYQGESEYETDVTEQEQQGGQEEPLSSGEEQRQQEQQQEGYQGGNNGLNGSGEEPQAGGSASSGDDDGEYTSGMSGGESEEYQASGSEEYQGTSGGKEEYQSGGESEEEEEEYQSGGSEEYQSSGSSIDLSSGEPEDEFATLKSGRRGPRGERGPRGPRGKRGPSGRDAEVSPQLKRLYERIKQWEVDRRRLGSLEERVFPAWAADKENRCPDDWTFVQYNVGAGMVVCKPTNGSVVGNPDCRNRTASFARDFDRCSWSLHCKVAWKRYGCFPFGATNGARASDDVAEVKLQHLGKLNETQLVRIRDIRDKILAMRPPPFKPGKVPKPPKAPEPFNKSLLEV